MAYLRVFKTTPETKVSSPCVFVTSTGEVKKFSQIEHIDSGLVAIQGKQGEIHESYLFFFVQHILSGASDFSLATIEHRIKSWK